jgi:hypothetical protein
MLRFNELVFSGASAGYTLPYPTSFTKSPDIVLSKNMSDFMNNQFPNGKSNTTNAQPIPYSGC